MSVPFDYESHQPPDEPHPELKLGQSFVAQIQSDCEDAAFDLAKQIQQNKLSKLIMQESVYDKRFCTLASQIGHTAFMNPISEVLTPEAQAVKNGIVVGRIFSRILCGGKILARAQLESVEHVHSLFGPSSSRHDYEYWIQPRSASLQDDASEMLKRKGIASAQHTSTETTESLFYDSASYFAANGIAFHIATKSKVRTLAEHSAMRFQLKKWAKITRSD